MKSIQAVRLALRRCSAIALLIALGMGLPLAGRLQAATYFMEAESFAHSSNGWSTVTSRTASDVAVLHGASGSGSATATNTIEVATAGLYRIWVRYLNVRWRGPFDLQLLSGEHSITNVTFDLEEQPAARAWDCVWSSFDTPLPAGQLTLILAKHQQRNCSGYTRQVDCLLVTDDLELIPDHRDYGIQTYMRATLDKEYTEPVYLHLFADHYRAPWYSHHYLAGNGIGNGLGPKRADLLQPGDTTPWCSLSRVIYQDSGAILNFSVRHSYYRQTEQFKAVLEFATAPSEEAIVRRMEVTANPNGLVVVMPPNLATAENRERFGRDLDFATSTGEAADNYPWPTIGRKPQRYPFFVSVGIGGYGTNPDQAIIDRERKTLDYFGFANWSMTRLPGGTWRTISNSYCRPDITAITNRASLNATRLQEDGKTADDVVYCMVMDEPTGQPLDFIATDSAYHEAFREWLKEKLKVTPQELMVDSWAQVVPVRFEARDANPALYYYSQRFRTRALGDFIAIQRRAFEAACGGNIPTLVNFSDGATYHANFYGQGVDYFELLGDGSQNAIWGEDWANGSSTYQCGAYNVDLMRAAAREHKQVIGHYLIAHAGRKPLDVKLKAAGNTARGVKMMTSFSYGVYWGSHEGGPAWRSSVWQRKPEMWGPHAELMREIGAVEEMLLPAMPAPAEVAILYSCSSDIWTLQQNYATGFERMHTWLALIHAQIPVDFLSEEQVAAGGLERYRVCYLSGPNLSRAAAEHLKRWVAQGGTLVATAGAATYDEYNRPLETVETLLPVQRDTAVALQNQLGSGSTIVNLKPQETITLLDGTGSISLLSISQGMTPRAGCTLVATNSSGAAAWVRGVHGQGSVHALGFLPALDYIRQAQEARRSLVALSKAGEEVAIDGHDTSRDEVIDAQRAISNADRERLERSANPWDYPASVRQALLLPLGEADIRPPITCSVPLVDAVYMTCSEGVVIPLANYTLLPLQQVEFSVRLTHKPKKVQSVHHGELKYRSQRVAGEVWIDFSLPLDSTDYITIR